MIYIPLNNKNNNINSKTISVINVFVLLISCFTASVRNPQEQTPHINRVYVGQPAYLKIITDLLKRKALS